jgi:predicted metal-dependent peptidase
LNIPDEYRSDETYISLGDQKGMAFQDSKGRQLPTGVHMMMPQESLQQIRAKKEGIIRLASGDPRCLEERAFQQVRGIISEVQEQDTSPWTHKIRSAVDYASQSSDWKYTHGRFNRRYFAQGIYASGRVFEEKGRITVAVDVSGSVIMQPDMLEAVFGVVDDLTRKYIVHLVCIDEQLFIPEKTNRSYVYQRGDWRFIKTGSMGTTFFSPLFNDYMKQHREMLLVITDGQIFDLEKLEPYRPTLWIVPADQRHRFAVPFGQVVSFSLKSMSIT